MEKLLTNTARALALDAIENAKSGHPGIALGAAPILTTLYSKHLRLDLSDSKWLMRDRFVLSAGHGSALLYSVLHLLTGALSLNDLKTFRKAHSKTPGHPENFATPFVDVSTGPLGQGVANAVGMAIAQKKLAAEFNKSGFEIFNSKIYVLVGDGCLMEGVAIEALDIASTLKLNNLIVLFDSNNMTIEGNASLARGEDVAKVYEAKGFYVAKVQNGESESEIDAAISKCKNCGKPSLVIITTKIGFGSEMEDKPESHGTAFNEQQVAATKQQLGLSQNKFFVDKKVAKFCKQIKAKKEKECLAAKKLLKLYEKKFPADFAKLQQFLKGFLDIKVNMADMANKDAATRESGGKALNQIAIQMPNLIGGNADVAQSTRQKIDSGAFLSAGDFSGRNIHFGVREHAMGAIINGIALHGGLKAYCSTFFSFVNYMTPAIRMAALMKLPVVFIFTSDSIGAGEDGPTHQPVEQLVTLRSMPNIAVYRPCDAEETGFCYEAAFSQTEMPAVIVLTRQKLTPLNISSATAVKQGAYVAYKPSGKIGGYFITSGSEVALCISAAKQLKNFAVINMVCTKNFNMLPKTQQNEILNPKITARIICEAAHENALIKYCGISGKSVCVNTFGFSASFADLFEHFGFTKENLINLAKSF